MTSVALTPDDLAEMRRLWEEVPGMSAKDIGERFGVSKNVVLGHAFRRNWTARGVSTVASLEQRLAAIDWFPPSGHCLWIEGHVAGQDTRFCAAPVREIGESWCPAHRKRCFATGGAKADALSAARPGGNFQQRGEG